MSAAEQETEETADYQQLIKALGDKLPKPQGYKLLLAIPKADEKTQGGIIKPDEAIHIEEVGTIVGLVISMGPDAYLDEKKFPSGPWCSEGDYITMRSYSGTRLKIRGFPTEFRLINDDTVEAVVNDPRGLEKVL